MQWPNNQGNITHSFTLENSALLLLLCKFIFYFQLCTLVLCLEMIYRWINSYIVLLLVKNIEKGTPLVFFHNSQKKRYFKWEYIYSFVPKFNCLLGGLLGWSVDCENNYLLVKYFQLLWQVLWEAKNIYFVNIIG